MEAETAGKNGERKGRRAPKQGKLPGTERKDRLKDIEKAASRYVAARDERMELTKVEVKTQGELLAAMRSHDLAEYRCDSEDLLVVVREGDAKVKVKSISSDGGPENEEE